HAYVEKICPICSSAVDDVCPRCEVHGVGYYQREIDLTKLVTNAMAKLGISKMPKVLKGVKGMVNANKYTEPMEKGILRAFHNIYIFKDGTSRFDATDMPITHFYPVEAGISVETARQLGYTKDYIGNELTEETQLVEMMHQDVILNRRGADYLLKTARFVDELLERFYGLKPFYNATTINDLVGKLVITLSPHTSCGVTNRIIGFTDANVGFAHPYVICARRRNCDGDEDSTMLLLD
ncbi:protein containing DNA polymerase II large subunit DP2, partial [mine drainage metagenome]